MPPDGAFLTTVIALVVIGGLIQLLVLAYSYRKGNFDPRPTVDGDRVYSDDRLNEMLYAHAPEEEDAGVDPEEADAVACPECHTLNERSFTFCRNCATELAGE